MVPWGQGALVGAGGRRRWPRARGAGADRGLRHLGRPAALGVALTRGALGLLALVRPGLPARLWVPDQDAASPGGRVLARALGGRDLALALGCLLAARGNRPIRGWVEAGALADTGDVLATLLAWRSLPGPRRRAVLVLAGGAAVVGWLSAPHADPPPAGRSVAVRWARRLRGTGRS